MIIEQTVEIPASRRLTIEVPREVPAGSAILAFTPAADMPLAGNSPRTAAEALQMATARVADLNRKLLSRLFGRHKGILGGDGVAYQRSIRDEWD
ncbi:hypothetical protein ACYULU_12330 [Breznakiellaceae bacterium SP9]